MTDRELDEIMLFRWPILVRQAMQEASDPWAKGFVLSIARHSKRPNWRPTPKQAGIMRRLLAEMARSDTDPGDLIEDERSLGAA